MVAKARARRKELTSSAGAVAQDLKRWLPSTWPLTEAAVQSMVQAAIGSMDEGMRVMCEIEAKTQAAELPGSRPSNHREIMHESRTDRGDDAFNIISLMRSGRPTRTTSDRPRNRRGWRGTPCGECSPRRRSRTSHWKNSQCEGRAGQKDRLSYAWAVHGA